MAFDTSCSTLVLLLVIKRFLCLNNDMKKQSQIDPKLKKLVGLSMELLGRSFRDLHGPNFYDYFLEIKKMMIRTRTLSSQKKTVILNQVFNNFNTLSINEQYQLAQGFSLQLEVTNLCENAFRTHKLNQSWNPKFSDLNQNGLNTWVITAHPTEARSKQILPLLRAIQEVMVQWLESTEVKRFSIESHLYSLLALMANTPLAPQDPPQVEDEADYLYRTCLRPEILNALCSNSNRISNFRIYSWVGGDKDGHPGVGPKQLLYSWTKSRIEILNTLKLWLLEISQLASSIDPRSKTKLNHILTKLDSLKTILTHDFLRVKLIESAIYQYLSYVLDSNSHLYWTKKINFLFTLFPALVMPIELRESSEVFKELFLEPKSKKNFAIFKMLQLGLKVSNRDALHHYLPSLIVSMTEKGEDLYHAHQMVRLVDSELHLPIVPLFENQIGLDNAHNILLDFKKKCPSYFRALKKNEKRHFEIMLGYSDSSKENGVLKSKLLISSAMRNLNTHPIKDYSIRFFHGSGGSISRGGGTLEEQSSGWSQEMITWYKATFQGEVVTRTFSSSDILLSQIDRLNLLKNQRAKLYRVSKPLSKLATQSGHYYRNLISQPDFIDFIQKATLYPHLHELKLGSRPSKRKSLAQISDLRAIPWVLTWTQARVLLPTWWGIGSAWFELSKQEQQQLMNQFKNNEGFWVSFIKQLAFSLAKVDLDVFRFQVYELAPAHKEILSNIEQEFKKTLQMYFAITKNKTLLQHKPWLEESINLRSAFIHPLNLLQIIGLQKGDAKLIRMTTTGIACGMLTTG